MGRVLGNSSLDDYSASARAIAACCALQAHPTRVAPPDPVAVAANLALLLRRLQRAGRLEGRGRLGRDGRRVV